MSGSSFESLLDPNIPLVLRGSGPPRHGMSHQGSHGIRQPESVTQYLAKQEANKQRRRKEREEEGEHDKKLEKRCVKCREWKDRDTSYGKHDTSSDGLQSICHSCKNIANTKKRNNTPIVRIKHHTSTRCLTQLGDSAPEAFVANLEHHIGYSFKALVRHLEQDLKDREGPTRKLIDALKEGYHVDHIRPLKLYKVINDDGSVDWDLFRLCWRMENLSAIPGTENLRKGSKYAE